MPNRRVSQIVAAFAVASCLAVPASLSRPLSAESFAWPLANHFFAPPIAFSPDGHYMALGGSVGSPADFCPQPFCTGRLHLWDLRSGQRVMATEDKVARVMSVVFSHDGRYLVAGHADGTVVVWGVADARVLSRFSCCSGTWIRALALSPDDSVLAIGAQGGQVVLWNMADDLKNHASVRVSRSLNGHTFGVSSVAFEPSGEYLLSSADDQHVRRWNVRTGASDEFRRAPGLSKAHRGMVKSVVSLDGGRHALTGAYWDGGTTKDYQGFSPPDQILRLWDVATGRPLRSYPLTWGIRCCIQVLNRRNLVAFLKATTWDEAPVLEIFNLDTGAAEREIVPSMGESFHAMAIHPNGAVVAVGIGDGHLLLLDLHTGTRLAHLVSVDEGWAVLAADGRIDYSDGFARWPCRNGVEQACAGGRAATSVKGLLAALLPSR